MKIKILKTNLTTRDGILKNISKKAIEDEIATDDKKLFKALVDREKQYTTGFQDGISIPHARIKSISKPIVYIVRNKTGVDWKSLDKKPTKVAITILLPDDKKAGNQHMSMIKNISNFLINEKDHSLLHEGNATQIKDILFKETSETKTKKVSNVAKYDFIAITSCPTGVAHTNMAAESFERFAKDNNLKIKVERQGAQGFVNKFSEKDIKKAELVIIASGRQIEEKERFKGKKILEVPIAAPIKSSSNVYKKAKKEAKLFTFTSKRRETLKKAFGGGGASPMQALMAGVSYMIPFVIVGGILIALSLGIGGKYVSGQGLQVTKGSFWDATLGVGVAGFTLMIPILAGFIASAIAGRSALAPAMIVGFVVGNSDAQLFNWDLLEFGSFENSAKLGFLGSIATGFLIGYLTKFWNIKISPKFPKVIKPIEPIIVIPILMVLIGWILFAFLLYVPLFYISFGLEKGVQTLIDENLFFIAALFLGAMIAFDMGGPINKIAFLIAGGLIVRGKPEVMGAVAAAIAVPPLGTGLAVFSKRLFRVKYDKEDEGNAISATFMSMIGITEGAIPFAVKYPKQVIVSNCIGGAVGAAVASLFQITDNAQHGGPIVYLLGAIGKDGITDYVWGLFFLLSILIGALVTAICMNVLLKIKQRKYVKTS